LVESTIHGVFGDKTSRAALSLPSGDTSLANGDVAVLGTVAPTVNFAPDP
jgi:hypothetical protein